jgi:lipopolysaccharide transport protein LptA
VTKRKSPEAVQRDFLATACPSPLSLKTTPAGSSKVSRLIRLAAAAVLAAALGRNTARSARAEDSAARPEPSATAPRPSRAAVTKDRSPTAAKNPADKAAPGTDDSPFADFASNKTRGPVSIHSDSLKLDYKGNTVLFHGHVHATQADGQLSTDSLNVKYGKDFHEIQEMVAEGDVRLSQGQRLCTGDHGVMNQAAHTVVLTGNPICHDNKDQISGDKIVVHLDTGKSEVEGGVKAVIFPREGKSRDNGIPANNSN